MPAPPTAAVAADLEEQIRLWRALRTATRRATLLDRLRREVESERDERLTALEGRLAAFVERERRLDETGWSDVQLPRRMIAFASGCLELGAELAADVYLCHDSLAMLAATMLRARHGGRIVHHATGPRAAQADGLESFLRAYEKGVLAAADATIADDREDEIAALAGEGRRVVILGIGDACNDGRCARIADALLRLGRQVTVVGPLPPQSPRPAVGYHVVDLEP
jgi:hypothetical protein